MDGLSRSTRLLCIMLQNDRFHTLIIPRLEIIDNLA